MNFVVNNTTKSSLVDLVCPHTCRGCGRLGAVLCECCKNDIIKNRQAICPICRQIVAQKTENVGECGQGQGAMRCGECDSPFLGTWIGGWRSGVLAKIVKEFKYHGVRACGNVLVDIIEDAIPSEMLRDEKIVVVPLPTIGKHVRERGLDHTMILAKKLARRRGWSCKRIIGRATDTVQVGAKVAERQKQAESTYVITGKIESEASYILLDDVWTTGATMLNAARVMREAGAERLFAAVLVVGKPKNDGGESAVEMKV